jgi:hypothetical protein
MTEEMTVSDLIGRDQYHRALVRYKESKNIRKASLVSTGRISVEGHLGNFTGIQNVILECLPLALHNEQAGSTWKLLMYLFRDILGKTRNEAGDPRTAIKYRPRFIMEKACINSASSFYNSIKTLEDKRIIYYDQERKFISINLFPLTWNIENEVDREKIERIMETEIGRVYRKIG